MLFKVSNIPTWSRRKKNKADKMAVMNASLGHFCILRDSDSSSSVQAHILKFSPPKTTRDILVSGHLYCALVYS